MKRRLLILALEDAAAAVHVFAMFLNEAAQEVRRDGRQPRSRKAPDQKYQDWLEGINVRPGR